MFTIEEQRTTDILPFTFPYQMHQYPQLNLMYRRKTQTKLLITYSFSLYLIAFPTELFESAQFLKSNCAHRCIITLAVVFRKHPGSAVSLQGDSKQAAVRNYRFSQPHGRKEFYDIFLSNGEEKIKLINYRTSSKRICCFWVVFAQ